MYNNEGETWGQEKPGVLNLGYFCRFLSPYFYSIFDPRWWASGLKYGDIFWVSRARLPAPYKSNLGWKKSGQNGTNLTPQEKPLPNPDRGWMWIAPGETWGQEKPLPNPDRGFQAKVSQSETLAWKCE